MQNLLGNREIPVVLGHGSLQLDVLLKYLVRHVPAGGHKVAARPQVPAPELPVQTAVLLQQMVTRFAFDRLHDSARRNLGRHTQQQVHMVRLDMPFQDLNLLGPTDLPDQCPGPQGNVPCEHRLAVLGDKDDGSAACKRYGSLCGTGPWSRVYRKPPKGFT